MAIIACASITLAQTVDITEVTWYYKLQASTAARPAKPTTATPSGWSTTEPTYTEGSTNSLYVCQKTTFSDGTFSYSDVSLSSSYEAAKIAYNKGASALSAANGKNRHYYLPSTGTPSNHSDGDLWFKTDKGFAMYHYDSANAAWVKAGLGSAAFDTLDAGGASIGYLNSLLIKNNISSNPVDYDYWNLSPYDITDDGFTFEGNTLKTTHLIARDEIDVVGGPGSRIKIPTTQDENCYVDIYNEGLIIRSHYVTANNERDGYLTTIYPSLSDTVTIDSEGGISGDNISYSHIRIDDEDYPSEGINFHWDMSQTNRVTGMKFTYSWGFESSISGVTKEVTEEGEFTAKKIFLGVDDYTVFNVYGNGAGSETQVQIGDSAFTNARLSVFGDIYSKGRLQRANWESIGNTTGQTWITYDASEYTELYVAVCVNSTGKHWVTFFLPTVAAGATEWYPTNHYGTTYDGYVQLRSQSGKISLWAAYNGTSNVTQTAQVYVYGR